MSRIRKFLMALSGGAALISTALANGDIDATEGRNIALSLVAAGLVFAVPNAEA